MNALRAQTWFLIALLLISIFLTWLILAPYLSVLVLSATLALLFRPLYQGLLKVLRYEGIAALAAVVVVALIVFLPLTFFGLKIFTEATALYSFLVTQGGLGFTASFSTFLHTHIPNLPTAEIVLRINEYAQEVLAWLIQNLGHVFSSIAQLFFLLTLTLLGLFYFFKDGSRIKKWLVQTMPLDPDYSEDIMREMHAVTVSVVRGTFIVALLVGIVMGAGFYLFAIPNPLFWAMAAAVTSVVPVIGPWLVLIPAIGYLFVMAHTAASIGLFFWSLVFTNVIYSVLSPQLMRRGVNIHPYFILLSVLGGISLFGPVGFITGPLIMALLLALLRIYKKVVVTSE